MGWLEAFSYSVSHILRLLQLRLTTMKKTRLSSTKNIWVTIGAIFAIFSPCIQFSNAALEITEESPWAQRTKRYEDKGSYCRRDYLLIVLIWICFQLLFKGEEVLILCGYDPSLMKNLLCSISGWKHYQYMLNGNTSVHKKCDDHFSYLLLY